MALDGIMVVLRQQEYIIYSSVVGGLEPPPPPRLLESSLVVVDGDRHLGTPAGDLDEDPRRERPKDCLGNYCEA